MSAQKAVQSEYALQQSAYEPSAEDFVFDKSIDIYTDRNYASVGFWKGVFTRFFKNVRAVIGLVIIVVCMFLALVGPHMNRYGYSDIQSVYDQETGKEITARSLSPRIPWLHRMISGEEYQDEFADRTFLFGTDSLGRDLWTRVWYGARVSLLIAFVTIFIDMIVGMSFGLISGYFGGFADDIMQRFVEIANSIPRLVIVGVLATIMPKGIGLVIVALLLTEWIGMSKIARAEMLKNKEQEYIMAKSGHTRGSTVDLTLFDMRTEKEVDMGGTFDWFGPESHPDYKEGLTPEQYANRMILREAMLRHGFKPLETEWWHFTLSEEPFPDRYFNFPVE